MSLRFYFAFNSNVSPNVLSCQRNTICETIDINLPVREFYLSTALQFIDIAIEEQPTHLICHTAPFSTYCDQTQH